MKIGIIPAIGFAILCTQPIHNAIAVTNFVYITGSSSFRGAVFTTMTNTVGAGVFDSAPTVVASGCVPIGTLDPHTADQMEFAGTVGGVDTVIKCAWFGSGRGIGDLCTSSGAGAESFLATSLTSQVTTNDLSIPDSHTVDLAFADIDQQDSLTTAPNLNNYEQVGIIPFVIVKNAQTNGTTITTPSAEWLRLDNVTPAQLRNGLSGGTPMALLTGNPTDTNWVYVAGRDNQSGAFVNTMLESGFGLSSSPRQIKVSVTNGTARIQDGAFTTGGGIGVAGQITGGKLATTMTYVGSATNLDPIAIRVPIFETNAGWYAIAYLSRADADIAAGLHGAPTQPAGDAVELPYCGFAETTANIENGTYDLWGNELLFQSANNLSAAGGIIYAILSTNIPANLDDVNYIKLSSMFASKTTSDSDPAHN